MEQVGHPGIVIAAARTRAKLTQRDLAVAAGVSHGAIAMVEKGQRYPTLETIQRLSPLLDLTVTIRPTGKTEWMIDGIVVAFTQLPL